MPAKSWTTPAQAEYLHTLMPDYIRRQAASKLHLFWSSMNEGFFGKWPEHTLLGLPLPTDPNARKLTADELVILGIAIKARTKQLESWFRYQRKKIRTTETAVEGGSSEALRTLFGIHGVKRRRAHKPIEVFQMRNPELIKQALTTEGYDNITSVDDAPDDFTDEADGTPEAAKKSLKSIRMRLRTRVVKALFEATSDEEMQACVETVEKEKEKLRAEELAGETDGDDKTAPQYQDAIDAVEGVYADIHRATFSATGWVGMTILGGPNPRMDGELTLKIICFGQTPVGNDFEDTCVDFNENVVEPFEGFVRMCYTAAQCKERALLQPTVETPQPTMRQKRSGKAPAKPTGTVSTDCASKERTADALPASAGSPAGSPASAGSPALNSAQSTPSNSLGEAEADPNDTYFNDHSYPNMDYTDMNWDASALRESYTYLEGFSPLAISSPVNTVSSPIPVPRPVPRPAYKSSSAPAAEPSTLTVNGFNFPLDQRGSTAYPLSPLFDCFRPPGRGRGLSTTATSSAASVSTTGASPAPTPFASPTRFASPAPFASPTADPSPAPMQSASLASTQSASPASTQSVSLAPTQSVSPTQSLGLLPPLAPEAVKTAGPTKAATFLTSLLTNDNSVANAPLHPVVVPSIATAETDIDDNIPTTRPPTRITPPAPKKASGKKAVAAAKADEREAAAKSAQKLTDVTNGAKRGPGRPRKQAVASVASTDTINVPTQEEEPVARIFRAPVDHAAINFRRRSREAAEKEKEAEKAAAEQEKADKRAAELKAGWAERVVEGSRTLTRVRKAPKHADGTEVQMGKVKKVSAPVGTATSSKSRSWADPSTTRAAAAVSARMGTKRQAATQLTSKTGQKK
ncbi:hypothetical protein B0H16DRAFT_1738469 [Mycena metata]|uniref:Uncharacterized protein n=1 Tax=Mycena metata TaxID=1033252 RepID=A0AAD7HJC7_9AGAR|nr:hypothetical protein B0H16DRAFT_1738469 [Mycena metata]